LILIAALTPAAVAAFFLPFIGDWGSRRGTRLPLGSQPKEKPSGCFAGADRRPPLQSCPFPLSAFINGPNYYSGGFVEFFSSPATYFIIENNQPR
jgi:hypothetical protein